MSEKTTIGGITYESIGSSNSNLLLKCNGTAKILWGTKLIDLIKNGKIASHFENLIFVVSNESEIKSDGIYILTKEESIQLWVCKNKLTYNITESFVLTLTSRIDIIEQKLGIDTTNENNKKTDTLDSDLFIMRGTIIMYSGIIPEGWGLCNGETYTYKGNTTTSPNLQQPLEQLNYIIKL